MNTYTKTFLICPHCGFHTDSSIDHLSEGKSFGPWYCRDCNKGFSGKIHGSSVVLEKLNSMVIRTLDLVVLEPQSEPVYFVLSRSHPAIEDENEAHQHLDYLYGEHLCPVNVVSDVAMICIGGDCDRHGLFQYVRSIEDSGEIDEEHIIGSFPEMGARSI